jgi:hypothetical protein
MYRHLNPYFHWCAGCWKWVCDCVHCVEPLNIKRQPVKDLQIRSLGYDRSVASVVSSAARFTPENCKKNT